VQLHFTTRVRYGFLSVQLNYTIRRLFHFMFILCSALSLLKWLMEETGD
jgi:hypothetical protein